VECSSDKAHTLAKVVAVASQRIVTTSYALIAENQSTPNTNAKHIKEDTMPNTKSTNTAMEIETEAAPLQKQTWPMASLLDNVPYFYYQSDTMTTLKPMQSQTIT
jgi:hypothetical protein